MNLETFSMKMRNLWLDRHYGDECVARAEGEIGAVPALDFTAWLGSPVPDPLVRFLSLNVQGQCHQIHEEEEL